MKIFKYLLMFIVPLYLLLVSIEYYSFNERFYESEFKKNNISERTNINERDLRIIGRGIIDYIKGDGDNLELKIASLNYKEVFREEEKSHMLDVKRIYAYGSKVKNAIFILMIIIILILFLKNKKTLLEGLVGAGIFSISFVAILFLMISIDYYKYFTYFHKLFFKDGTWTFDEKESLLINILPLDFFQHITVRIVLMFLISSLLVSVTSYIIKKNKLPS
ncbi:TIGR01906 family membrane protein [Anaeromicrobium sediminis]|uniref:TIGR01906 family membrane protein n=1 Tax=Anaeromicrobium sediminis TaxID=1478221 RepID=A0A267MHW7_9FIRM|nr:TIGR01906 family membrane protein [Anaeromicrobium sediminis]PAB58528.1 TIGR01906 family membrane protein [Anaeromicrobium sediminis]